MRHIVIVPGVGKAERSLAVRGFAAYLRRRGVTVHVFKPDWSSDESAAAKIERISALIENCGTESKSKITVVGYSAGATLAFVSLGESAKHVEKAYLISGKLRGSRTIGPFYRNKYPALYEVVRLSEGNDSRLSTQDRQKITTTQPIVDLLVPVGDMRLDGVRNKRLIAFTHPVGIVAGLLFVSQIIAKKS